MLKEFVVWAYVLTIISFTAASFKFNSKDTIKGSQFVLKSLAEFLHQGDLYEPLRFYTTVIGESFNNDEEHKSLKSVLATSTKIISDLLLISPLPNKIKQGENNQCPDILLGQKIHFEDLEADIAIFAVNYEENEEIVISKKCEISENNTVKIIALEINAEKIMELDEISQIKELCIAISSTLYEENEEEKQVLLNEIEGALAKQREIKIAPILGACIAGMNNCETCDGTNTNCVACSTGYFISGGACCACQEPCAQCSGTATSCTSCIAGYWNNAGICSACQPPCDQCNLSSTNCTSCINGYYVKGNICLPCQAPCGLCIGTSTYCIYCEDAAHMVLSGQACTCLDPNAFFSLTTHTCQCKIGYFGTPNTCAACNTNCATCSSSSSNCATCIDATHMTAAPECACPTNGELQGTTCVCNSGYYFSANTVCSACNSNCATCFRNAWDCDTCIDTTHMSAGPACACPVNSYLQGTTCVCGYGYYFSTATVCSACNSNCGTCSETASDCVTCFDRTHMSAAPACVCPSNSIFTGLNCECNSGYYFSSNTVCSACTFPCSECSTSATTCTACEDGYYLNGDICSPDQCQCEAPCATCSISPTTCTSCDNPDNMALFGGTCICYDPHAYFSTTSNTCVCNEGFFNNNGVCIQCILPCFTCSWATDCQSCVDGYWLNGETCQTCTDPCAKCINSATQCTACVSGTALNPETGTCLCLDPNSSFNDNSLTCTCNAGYYMSGSGICELCKAPCAQCLNSPAFCVVCDDFANMNLNAATGICTCKDPNAIFNPATKACQINPGCNCNCNQCAPIINNYNYNYNIIINF